jgi:hypothetical protein
MKVIFRIIVLPVFIAFILISLIRDTIGLSISFLRYGGELVAFKKDSKETIRGLFNLVENNNNINN